MSVEFSKTKLEMRRSGFSLSRGDLGLIIECSRFSSSRPEMICHSRFNWTREPTYAVIERGRQKGKIYACAELISVKVISIDILHSWRQWRLAFLLLLATDDANYRVSSSDDDPRFHKHLLTVMKLLCVKNRQRRGCLRRGIHDREEIWLYNVRCILDKTIL